jgi:hypothetical protein
MTSFSIFGWGAGVDKYFTGGAPGVPVSWWWRIWFRWRWRGWWYERCFYPFKEHEANTGPELAEYRAKHGLTSFPR